MECGSLKSVPVEMSAQVVVALCTSSVPPCMCQLMIMRFAASKSRLSSFLEYAPREPVCATLLWSYGMLIVSGSQIKCNLWNSVKKYFLRFGRQFDSLRHSMIYDTHIILDLTRAAYTRAITV